MNIGTIISSYGRNYTVECNAKTYQAVSKGKKTEFVVGDQVKLHLINNEQAQITELIARHNLIYRSDHNRSKMIASNLDQLLIVVAAKPSFNPSFLNSCLISAEASQIPPIIIVNKIDLAESLALAQDLEERYQHKLGYSLIKLSATHSCEQLAPLLHGRRSLLIGQSGVGKSTITNQICPHAAARIGEIAKYENSGCHTTTNATLYHLDAKTELIDCPGLQEFGLYHLELSELAENFPEFRPLLGGCKFSNCIHLTEPGCVIQAAKVNGSIQSERYDFYRRLALNLQSKRNY